MNKKKLVGIGIKRSGESGFTVKTEEKNGLKTSNSICQECGKEIIDSQTGYITGCDHYPLDPMLNYELKRARANIEEDTIKQPIKEK